MKNSFWDLIWSSFLDIQGILIGFLGIVITIILSRFRVATPIPLDFIIIIGLFTLLLIATLFQASYKSFKLNQKIQADLKQNEFKLSRQVLPKIIRAKKRESENLEIEFLLENSPLFSNDTLISFYYTDDDEFERLIGAGIVRNVQRDGKIYALLDIPIASYQDILNKLANNDANILGRTVVKPSITRDTLQRYLI